MIHAFILRAMRELPSYTTIRSLAALMVLSAQPGPIRTRDLARFIGIPKPSITRLTDHLRHAGLVEKSRAIRAGGDLRDCWVSLTDKGRRVVRDLELELQSSRARA